MSRVLALALGFFTLSGCDGSAPPGEAVGGSCASYGTPCFCSNGRTECAPHSTNVCPCDDGPPNVPRSIDEEPPTPDRPTAAYRHDPAPFAACTADEECVAVRRQCDTTAVHRDNREEYLATLRGIRFRCTRPPERADVSAICRGRRCVVVEVGD